ncbi:MULTISPECIES: hypothetical protein [Bacillus]|uniref:Uncharacterized protein n=1 Tax=Bacillus pseudomycoides TaxID=64104 RepID=A0A1Y3MLF6_9BACI|nr:MULTISPECIES: hypothetical protein [Bacillus cereus group]EOP55518.1 hypothetical protein IIW_00817 [Bacillus cereus VD136]EOP74063.1 hypothetical protein KOW_00149 [Bacillus cereus VDM006]EOQ11525.1 hypothetical protein KOY_04982 [Bacillus cereus VDM021]MDF2082152.1 hypothetical protein [Bacillus pseudomycoides]OUM49711.1 hypothetical protein BW425_05890 [Bacillus pseudomycoides]
MKYAISTLAVLITFIVLQLLPRTIFTYFYMQDSRDWTSVATITPAVSANYFFDVDYIQLFFVFLSFIVGFVTLKFIERRKRVYIKSKSGNRSYKIMLMGYEKKSMLVKTWIFNDFHERVNLKILLAALE